MSSDGTKVLEARFHPRSKRSPVSVTVGQILVRSGEVLVVPAQMASRAIQPFEPGALLAKLKALVDQAAPDPCLQLVQLRSDYWSFFEVNVE